MSSISAIGQIVETLLSSQLASVGAGQLNSSPEIRQNPVSAADQDNDRVELGFSTGEDQALKCFSSNRLSARAAYLGQNSLFRLAASADAAGAAAASDTAGSPGNAAEALSGEADGAEEDSAENVNRDKGTDGEYLDEEEQAELDDMKERDDEVKTHEQAHKAAGGSYADSPVYEYSTGPDGKQYATDGHVNIDISKEEDPRDTIVKMSKVIASANAPAEPSTEDKQVAAQARKLMNEAQLELNEETSGDEEGDAAGPGDLSAYNQLDMYA